MTKKKSVNVPKRARIWLQYAIPSGPHILPCNKGDDAAVFRTPAPMIQNNQVTKIQTAWAPMDAIGCLDQTEWTDTREYAPPVRQVQQDANLFFFKKKKTKKKSMWMKWWNVKGEEEEKRGPTEAIELRSVLQYSDNYDWIGIAGWASWQSQPSTFFLPSWKFMLSAVCSYLCQTA